MSTPPSADATRTGPAAAWTALLVVAVTWAFLPLEGLASFDVVKLPVLFAGAGLLLVWSGLRVRDRVPADPLLWAPVGLAILAVLAGLAAGRSGALRGPLLACGALGAGIVAMRQWRAAGTPTVLARGIAVASLGAALYAVVQVAGGDPAPWGDRRVPVAMLGNVSFAAEVQAAALPAAIFLVWRPLASWDRMLGGAAALGAVAHLVLTRSRIDLIAAAAVVLVFGAWWLRARGRRRGATWVAIVALAAATLLAGAFLAHGTGALEIPFLGRSDTVAVRVHIYGAVLATVGAGGLLLPSGVAFAEQYARVRPEPEYVISLGRSVESAHNDVLGVAAHVGLPLALVGAACAVFLLVRVWRADDGPAARFLVSGTLVALIVSGLASTPLAHVTTALLGGLAWGAALALAPVPRPADRRQGVRAGVVVVAGSLLVAAVVPAYLMLYADAFLALARQQLALDNGAETLRLMDAAASADSRAFAPRRELGGLYVNLHEPELAERALRDALLIRPGNPETRADLARALFQAERFDEGRELLAESLAICPWHPELLAARAQLALHEDRADDAVTDLTRAADTHRHEPRMGALLAEARLAAVGGLAHEEALDVVKSLFARGDDAHAMRTVTRMLQRDPMFLAAVVATARRLVRDDPDTAARLIAAAVEHPPAGEDAGFLQEAGTVLLRAGRTEAGERFIGRSRGVQAAEALRRDHPQEALRLAQFAIPRDPDPRHYLTEARALARLGDRRAAVRSVGAALALGQIDPALLRDDPDISGLLPDEELELILERAAALAAAEPPR